MLRLEDQRSRRSAGAGSCDMAQALTKRINRGLATGLRNPGRILCISGWSSVRSHRPTRTTASPASLAPGGNNGGAPPSRGSPPGARWLIRRVTVPRDATFEWYDSWILAALIWATDREAAVPLWRLIATADALNKAIVSRGELELGIGRLARAGYVRVVPDGFEATPTALALKIPGPPIENVAKAIGARAWSPQAEMPRTPDALYVTAEAYEKALKKYGKESGKEHRSGDT